MKIMKSTTLLGALFLMLVTFNAAGFYDPNLQRWVTRDPLGDPTLAFLPSVTYSATEQLNLYFFVNNNPANRLDALGLIGKCPECKSQFKMPPSAGRWPFIRVLTCKAAFDTCTWDCANLYGDAEPPEGECLDHCLDDCWSKYLQCLGRAWKPRPKPTAPGGPGGA